MEKATQVYKRSLSGSVGAGMGSLFGGGGKTYFILEHKVSSKYHKAGEAQEIIVDQVELGRDSSCAVRFDETFSTVSRRHAAIMRDGANWKLVQLSTTNTTFLNGHPIQKEWYLQNGDEIQLSVNGPKLGFIIPSGNKSTVGSIGLSRRLSLFRQQALRPYKTAMYVMATFLVLLICGGVGYGYWDYQHDLRRAELSEQKLAEVRKQSEEEIAKANAKAEMFEKSLDSLKVSYSNLSNKLSNLKSNGGGGKPVITPAGLIGELESSVYFVLIRKIEVSYNGASNVIENIGCGTGFLLNDGRFITARHVVEPWNFPNDEQDETNITLNLVANNGGKVVCYLEAYSPSGDVLSFTSTNARINRSEDKTIVTEAGNLVLPSNGALDFAVFNTGRTGALKCDVELSRSLPIQTKLMILGYPMGFGANSEYDIHPLYSEAVVAKEGLDHGLIITTATTFEHGNSGGPVFAVTNDGSAFVVGLVSAGTGRSTGIVVPISSIK